MTSLRIYQIKGLTLNDVLKIKNFEKINEEDQETKVKLKQHILNFKEEKNLISFTFKHETATKIEIDGKNVSNFHVYSGEIWILFKKNHTFLFLSTYETSEDLIYSMILQIIQTSINNLEKELISEKVDLKECFVEVINTDASKVTSSWFRKITPHDQSAFLSGTLRDDEGRESNLYRELKKTAQQQSSISIISKKLANKITISESKISSRNNEINHISLIDYFEKILYEIMM
ncbi:MAG: hypothetical protein Q4P18_07150 [Methanobrevibacter sp.]|uniref:hypothetical protein n=1 Tax=Methanobrevibacter sp. TaxID=66852 RepID=UPI0026DF7814|nr:hypothetical protein [Methanobrevibacter sp.]MDO5849294.1 hypothetical protein [Methanobrevibacter sp.]